MRGGWLWPLPGTVLDLPTRRMPARLRPASKVGLGLRLGPLGSPTYVLGWQIVDSAADSMTLQVDSAGLTAHKVLLRQDSQLVLATFIFCKRRWSRLSWLLVAPMHRWTEPYLLGRAAARG